MSQSDALDRVRALARACAHKSLRLDQSKFLLESMMIADALSLEGGNITAAADRLGVDRTVILRRIKHVRREL